MRSAGPQSHTPETQTTRHTQTRRWSGWHLTAGTFYEVESQPGFYIISHNTGSIIISTTGIISIIISTTVTVLDTVLDQCHYKESYSIIL